MISNFEYGCLELNKTIKSNNMNAVSVATVQWGHDIYRIYVLILRILKKFVGCWEEGHVG